MTKNLQKKIDHFMRNFVHTSHIGEFMELCREIEAEAELRLIKKIDKCPIEKIIDKAYKKKWFVEYVAEKIRKLLKRS